MRLILASNNAHKLLEFRAILQDSGVEIVSQAQAGCRSDPEETGETFGENARIKAQAVLEATGEAAVADDSGLCVDALSGAPGVRSARYTGRHGDSDFDRRALLLKNLEGEEHRAARFVSCICCLLPDGRAVEARGECRGVIARKMRGEGGFGYDAVFIPEGYDRTMAELTAEEKNAISHRGRALRCFAQRLQALGLTEK